MRVVADAARLSGVALGVWVLMATVPQFNDPATENYGYWVFYMVCAVGFAMMLILPWRFIRNRALWPFLYILFIVLFILWGWSLVPGIVWSSIHGAFGLPGKITMGVVVFIVITQFIVLWKARPRTKDVRGT